jgi:hypothetical protein
VDLPPKGDFNVTIEARVQISVFRVIFHSKTPKNGWISAPPASKEINVDAKTVGPIYIPVSNNF